LLGAAPPAKLEVAIAGLRSTKGALKICVTSQPDKFPNCQHDPLSRRLAVPAAAAHASFPGMPSGTWAVSLLHDENDNAKLDTFMGIPKEGVGFSRNPVLRMGPPKFTSAAVQLTSGQSDQTIKMKYFL
jgi:uncharacterized protein (DUF2141 family)